MIDIHNEVFRARERIQPYIRETPLDFSISLSKLIQAQVYLKCENLQYTGSFKVRGAFNKLLTLTPAQRQQGIVTASSGNHGAAVAFGLKTLHIPGTIFVPENASSAKIENIRNYDIPLKFYATDCAQTEMYALEYAKNSNQIYISPYNDVMVIAGQGTIALELTHQLNHIDAILVPIGGGGLISGIASFIKAVSPQTTVIGCIPEYSPVMLESIKAGKIIDIPTYPTLSDATAGGIVQDSITFEFFQHFVDKYIVVTEQEIKQAIIALIQTQRLLVEGAAGVALASFLQTADQYRGKNVVVILSGANISIETLKRILI